MKAISSYLQKTDTGRVQEFEKNMTGYAKKILGNIQDYEFYTGGSQNPDGMVALLNYREDGVTPFFTFWKDGDCAQLIKIFDGSAYGTGRTSCMYTPSRLAIHC